MHAVHIPYVRVLLSETPARPNVRARMHDGHTRRYPESSDIRTLSATSIAVVETIFVARVSNSLLLKPGCISWPSCLFCRPVTPIIFSRTWITLQHTRRSYTTLRISKSKWRLPCTQCLATRSQSSSHYCKSPVSAWSPLHPTSTLPPCSPRNRPRQSHPHTRRSLPSSLATSSSY